ncbi:XRN 5'-3' exonuclease N-terminus-domain-containing protein [Dipodascopsis uninucleata]
MGIPKFFRWISERYPLISQLIEGDKIPEFDNLYLDMNGVVHMCTHKDTNDTSFRLSEEEMFMAIFNYIELLFEKVKPKQLFFMAIDGVAPRAKMNQQRSRRFKTALDAENARKKAIKEGVELPKEPPFDTNAITPGTEFMSRLSKQLHYFVSKKVSEDSRWQNIDIILSGHEVPGEGEHKIMEYIRASKSQVGYNPNTRHCLYGLDADLIMLGLLSHDPHFCLLREEVTFGPSRNKPKEIFHQNFFLLHLSLVREYLEMEFKDMKKDISFKYDFERILDDFILLCIFVGNDFLPNIPQLHINEGALSFMFEAYKKALPNCRDYITFSGTINLEHLRFLLKELMAIEFKAFETQNDDLLYLESKQINGNGKKKNSKDAMKMNEQQKLIFQSIEEFVLKARADGNTLMKWEIPYNLIESNAEFIEDTAGKLALIYKVIDSPQGKLISLSIPQELDSSESDEEADFALQRVLKQFREASIVDNEKESKSQNKQSVVVLEKFNEWKDSYYKEKFGFGLNSTEKLTDLCENYVEGLQWVLNYYYKGISSWSWFFRYHYAPRVSDISKGLGVKLDFKLGNPFRPFEQLMGVLPDLSNKLIPQPYRYLMSDTSSPILDFYPKEFELDMNGKKMDWEAVVKIPFVDEQRLLKAMKPLESKLTEEEKQRNSFGEMIKFSFDKDMDSRYESSMELSFPEILHNHCRKSVYHFPLMEGRVFRSVLCEGVGLGAEALAGFPTLKNIPYTAELTTRHHVNVFQQDSRREAMIVTLEDIYEEIPTDQLAQTRLNNKIYLGWPYLHEGKVVSIADDNFKYEVLMVNGSHQIISKPQTPADIQNLDLKRADIQRYYARLGVNIGEINVVATVKLLKGMKQMLNGSIVKHYDDDPDRMVDAALQATLTSVTNEDERYKEKAALKMSEQFPIGTRGFYMGETAYCQPAQVIEIKGSHHGDVYILKSKSEDMTFGNFIASSESKKMKYFPSFVLSKELQIPPLLLSKITSSFTVLNSEKSQQSTNIGLNLKFEAKKEKVLGYTRRSPTGWEFSDRAKDLILQYKTKFPDLFQGLIRNLHTDRPTISTVLKISEDKAKSRLDEIKAFLKASGAKEADRVSLDSERLLTESVRMIEAAVDKMLENVPEPEAILEQNVPQGSLLKPSDAVHRLGNQKFLLGDRVVYVKDTGNVPIATKGTIIGITTSYARKILDVVWDQTFLAGIDFSGRCSAHRGMIVESSAVVNLTNKQLVYKPHGFNSDSLGRHSNGIGYSKNNSSNTIGSRGRGDGYRGRGGRGRGDFKRGTSAKKHSN